MLNSNPEKIKDADEAARPRPSTALPSTVPSISFLSTPSSPDSLTELIQSICQEAKRSFKSYSGDVVFAIEAVTGLKVNDPSIVEAVKQHRLEILEEFEKSLDRDRKKNKKEFLTEYFDRPPNNGTKRVNPKKPFDDDGSGTSSYMKPEKEFSPAKKLRKVYTKKKKYKEKVYFPGDFENGKNPLPSKKVTFLQNDEPDDHFILESFSEENDLICLKILNFSSEIRDKINEGGGKGTVDILKLLVRYYPVHISDKVISKTTGISIRTIKRRRVWLKGNAEWIDSLLKGSEMNFGPFWGVSIP
jgi:hypothetical protein